MPIKVNEGCNYCTWERKESKLDRAQKQGGFGIMLQQPCLTVRDLVSFSCRERKQEILKDSRVQAAMQRNRQPNDAKLTQGDSARQPVAAGR